MELKGKAAVITGAARGVGRATALRLARLGCSSLINYHTSRADAEKTAEEARALGVKSVCFQGSVADDAACRGMVAAAVKAFGRLDVVVNNAGTTRFIAHHDLEAVTDEDWASIFGTNVKGAFQMARAARPHLEAAGSGAIINISSVAAYTANGSSIPYGASKAAMLNLTVALARVLAPKIRVNAVAPGVIEGEWARQGWGDQYEAKRQARVRETPLGRICQPDDVAEAVVSLLAGSDLVTGHTLSVEGGVNLGMR